MAEEISAVRTTCCSDWKSANFEPLLLKNVEKCSYAIPRRIQAAVIPLIMNGCDLFGHAETGSGKTLAFILPIVDGIMKKGVPENTLNAPIALIVAPTRELVSQLYNQTRKITEGTGVTVAQCYGRTDIAKCLADIRKGCNILFATPGRLMDFVSKGRVNVRNIRYFVLDEADRMLNVDGFRSNMLDLTETQDFPTFQFVSKLDMGQSMC
uniref:ATP-dependent RNA helicase n=1 Tax=Parascaris equorum TaxID=6256 RepID=A0A914RY71_PAREQ